MINSDQLTQLQELLGAAQNILIVCGPNPSSDFLAAAGALHSSLEAQGKQSLLVTPFELKPDSLEKPVQPQTVLGNRDLTVSFEYRPEAVDKVSYHIDENQQRFYLVIRPQKGAKPLNSESVEFSYSGADADLIILVGVSSLESLEHLYTGFEQLYQDTNLISFHTYETGLGQIRLSSAEESSLSELMARILTSLQLPLDAGDATNLLSVIETKTDHLQSLMATADTFEIVAQLMRLGARRAKRKPAAPTLEGKPTPSFADALKTGPAKSNSVSPSKKKNGTLQHQPSEFSVGGRG